MSNEAASPTSEAFGPERPPQPFSADTRQAAQNVINCRTVLAPIAAQAEATAQRFIKKLDGYLLSEDAKREIAGLMIGNVRLARQQGMWAARAELAVDVLVAQLGEEGVDYEDAVALATGDAEYVLTHGVEEAGQ